ncbi:hypothetical protein N8I77_002943 [Diaporthe amygdali]|uniref:Uncharacterized protein n=1 Tax=Phomopsis amygdali TaxID=1214568 RepID=A0AAD9W764_PHOAM|nr:hypothetical protein N8I77_002943 [Diaporthe amygdali]
MRKLELRNDFGTRTCTTVVVDAWKVACWRTSSLVVHHTLVLAALLSIDSRQPRHNAATMSTVENGIHSQELMATFWKEIHDMFPGSIPANIVFLPGEKLRADNYPGFGWAPEVLAKIDEMERSELLRARQEYTDLIPNEGLLVKLPGILLRLSSPYLRRQILGMDEPRAFYLSLQAKGIGQWMSAVSTTHAREPDFLSEVAQRLSQLAIIVPHEIIPESSPIIALLVEIYEETCTEKLRWRRNLSITNGSIWIIGRYDRNKRFKLAIAR